MESTLCGGMLYGGELVPIFVRAETGDVYYETSTGERMSIDPLLENQPREVDNINIVEKAITGKVYGPHTMGVIYAREYAIIITSESTVEKREYHKLFEATGNPIAVDMDVVDTFEEE